MRYLILAFLFLIISSFFLRIEERPILEISKQKSAINFNTSFLQIMSLGNKRLIADYLWVQSLLEADLEHYEGKDLNNWLYLRFKTIVDLDPKFLEAYRYGGEYLSVIKDDPLGAKELLDIGLINYPNDYQLNWISGFNYYYELGDTQAAHNAFTKILYHPSAPPNLPTIVAKLKMKIGTKEDALELVEQSLKKIDPKNKFVKQKFENDIISLKLQIDLECLNSGKNDCILHKPEGYNYILKNGKYISDRPFRPFKFFERK
jgi:tetratricopeptide (TPR) repeat protein